MANAELNLKSMSVADLVALRDRVQEELARKISVERSALEKQIAALAELEAGMSARRSGAETTSRRRKKADDPSIRRPAKRRAAARYKGPNGETWSGFGRAPRWLTDLERPASLGSPMSSPSKSTARAFSENLRRHGSARAHHDRRRVAPPHPLIQLRPTPAP